MDSITKSKLTHAQIEEMAKAAFGSNEKVESFTELKDGYFNSAFMLEMNGGQKAVLKVSPSKDIRVMRYEKNIMEVEAFVLGKMSSLGSVPVPKVLYYSKNCASVANEFLFMEFIEGIPLNKIRANLTEEQRSRISGELGGYVKQINEIEGSHFGYILDTAKRFATWGEAFLFMVRELLEDASDAGVMLPYEYEKLYTMIEDKRDVLDQVKKPSLVHKDLWQGNIFVDPKEIKITGLIDCERAVYGDSLLEPACGFLHKDADFLKSYIGRASLSEDEIFRTILYRIYLFLIMVIECAYRKYPDNEGEKWSRGQLDTALEELVKRS